ncbi:MAG TPA: histidine kinase [Streptomyces sp.]|nr:histidine kinase [Streptomyces sp.]
MNRPISGARWPPWLPGPTPLLLAGTAASAALSVVSLWWAWGTAACAFIAGRGAGRGRPTAVALSAVLAAGVVAVSVVPEWVVLGGRFVVVMVCAALLPWFAGRFWRQYRELVRAGWERAELLEREQQLVAEQARLRERTRIAQDMHDVLGHDLSLIALSAGALKLAPDLTDDRRASAQEIRARAEAAVDRLGEVIGVLREESSDDTVARPSDAGIEELEELVEEASRAGLAVDWRTEGEGLEVPPVTARAVHRVVQEALTNAAKHAPSSAISVSVSVRARHSDADADAGAETEVRVESGPGPVAADTGSTSGGRGLIGLDERVRLAGGTFQYGPEDGKFVVFARLPHARTAVQPSAAGPPPPPSRPSGNLPQEHRRARRRLSRTLIAALTVPLFVAALLGGALRGWEVLVMRDSVLAADDYARLRIGQDRAEVARYLPDRQTPRRQEAAAAAAEPAQRTTRCEYFAMTADPFDDRSGDAYRLCFRAGVLVSTDVLAG